MDIEISVDEDVVALLKSTAEPFVDTPNSVLRRLLGLEGPADAIPAAGGSRPARAKRAAAQQPRRRGTRTRAPSGTLLPEGRYEAPLLRALVAAGGQGPSQDVIGAAGRELKDALTQLDLELLGSGGVRWQSRIQFVRLRLIQRELMDRHSPRGIWAISDKGREYLDSLTEQDQ